MHVLYGKVMGYGNHTNEKGRMTDGWMMHWGTGLDAIGTDGQETYINDGNMFTNHWDVHDQDAMMGTGILIDATYTL